MAWPRCGVSGVAWPLFVQHIWGRMCVTEWGGEGLAMKHTLLSWAAGDPLFFFFPKSRGRERDQKTSYSSLNNEGGRF